MKLSNLNPMRLIPRSPPPKSRLQIEKEEADAYWAKQDPRLVGTRGNHSNNFDPDQNFHGGYIKPKRRKTKRNKKSKRRTFRK